jgi:general secretion pathway protein K
MAITNQGRGSRGGALLAVLWLSAALSAIAFSLANTVRGETERTSTAVEGLRTQYLAEAGVERGILRVKWALDGGMLPNIPGRYSPATPILPFSFPSGQALVEVIPETAKININLCQPVMLLRLFLALGVDPARAGEIVLAVMDWRGPAGQTPFDAFYLSLTPSFRARHASFEEIEELLLVRGITRDLFYGGYDRDAQGRLVPRTGLKDCVSVFGSTDSFDVNTAPAAVLVATGIPPEVAAALVARRRVQPFQNAQQVGAFAPGGAEMAHLRTGGNSIFTMRSTARLTLPNGKLSDLRRTCAATVKFMPPDYQNRIQILRWYENAWTP